MPSKTRLLRQMWKDPKVQHYEDKRCPRQGSHGWIERSIFLAGPTSRRQIPECNWRCEAVFHLRRAGYEGTIFIPEPRGIGRKVDDFTDKNYVHRWESSRLLHAPAVVFWIPRDGEELLGLNTNLELGIILGRMGWSASHPWLYVGWPEHAQRMGLPRHYYELLAGGELYHDLREMCEAMLRIPQDERRY